jgi:hypothetical protein
MAVLFSIMIFVNYMAPAFSPWSAGFAIMIVSGGDRAAIPISKKIGTPLPAVLSS